MAITTQDVKLFKSERMDDTPEGGGRMTGLEVIDNQLNNVFDDTSRLDRVYGRVSIRKVFGAVTTTNQDKFLGVHAIISDPPDDGQVAVTIVELNDHNDHREDAKDMVEAYLVTSVVTPLTLYDTQPQGSRTIIAYVDLEDAYSPPGPGDVLVLSVEKETDPNFGFEQFVRVDTVSSYVLVFLNRRKRVYTFELTGALAITFPGADLVEFPGSAQRPTRVRTTDLNPAARYYGVVPLEVEAEPGDSTLDVATILQPVVPASYSEAPVLDQQVGDTGLTLIEAGPDFTFTASMSSDASGLGSLRAPGAILPGSAAITLDNADNAHDAVFDDSGDGTPDRISGGASSGAATCTADYPNATLSFTGLKLSSSYTVTVLYRPAANFSDVQHTKGTLITELNRGFNYAHTAIPKPSPGSTRIRYRTLGRWYDLRDNGGGQLTGAAGTGAGTVNYTTGTINVTVGYQPDVGSQVLFGWGTGAHYTQDTTPDALLLAAHRIVTASPIEPGSLSAEYVIGATTYTITDDGGGVLTGAATGRVSYDTGEILAELAQVPAEGTVFDVSYDGLGAFLTYTPSPQPTPDGSGDVALTLPDVPIKPGTARFSMAVTNATYGIRGITYRDRGDGTLTDARFGGTWGTINYTTGAVVAKGNRSLPKADYNGVFGTWSLDSATFTFVSIAAIYQDGAAGGALNETITPTELVTDVSGGAIESLVGGSLLYTHNARSYFDVGGDLFRIIANVATNVGTFDAVTGLAVQTSWAAGARVASLNALLTRYGRWPMTSVVWSTPGDPIRSGSFQVTDGINTAISDNAGILSGAPAAITGSIDYETGVYMVTFAAPGIAPETGRYNAVILTYLPLNPNILGLDPVRLPLSGTVPVIAQGDTLVIHNTVTTALPNPVVAGTTYALPRGNLAYIVLYDSVGAKIPTDRYTTDLVVAEITFENPLDLSGFTQPLQAEHRIEDMLFCLDAELSGLVNIVPGGLTHTFPVPGSYVSSAKLIGDLQASASEPFDQQAFTGVWSDTLIGSEATGEYNDLVYPIEVTNAGAVKDRFRLEFLTSNTFRVIAEQRGVIAGGNGTIGSDFSPVNPLNGQPFFTIRALGWGSGWVAGNQLRFNTVACAAPLWLLRCTLQGPEQEPDDNVRLQFRGDSQ